MPDAPAGFRVGCVDGRENSSLLAGRASGAAGGLSSQTV